MEVSKEKQLDQLKNLEKARKRLRKGLVMLSLLFFFSLLNPILSYIYLSETYQFQFIWQDNISFIITCVWSVFNIILLLLIWVKTKVSIPETIFLPVLLYITLALDLFWLIWRVFSDFWILLSTLSTPFSLMNDPFFLRNNAVEFTISLILVILSVYVICVQVIFQVTKTDT